MKTLHSPAKEEAIKEPSNPVGTDLVLYSNETPTNAFEQDILKWAKAEVELEDTEAIKRYEEKVQGYEQALLEYEEKLAEGTALFNEAMQEYEARLKEVNIKYLEAMALYKQEEEKVSTEHDRALNAYNKKLAPYQIEFEKYIRGSWDFIFEQADILSSRRNSMERVRGMIMKCFLVNMDNLAVIAKGYTDVKDTESLYQKLVLNHIYPKIKDNFVVQPNDLDKYILYHFSEFLIDVKHTIVNHLSGKVIIDGTWRNFPSVSNGIEVLQVFKKDFGLDYKSFAILGSDGVTVDAFFTQFTNYIKRFRFFNKKESFQRRLSNLFLEYLEQHQLRTLENGTIDTQDISQNKKAIQKFIMLFANMKDYEVQQPIPPKEPDFEYPKEPTKEDIQKPILEDYIGNLHKPEAPDQEGEILDRTQVPTLPNFKGLTRVLEQLKVHLTRLAIKGKVDKVIGRVLFPGNLNDIEEVWSDCYEISFFLKLFGVGLFRKQKYFKEYVIRQSVDDAVEGLYEMLKYLKALITKGEILVDNGASKNQRYQGRVILKVAERLVEIVQEIAVEIETKLAIDDANIGLVCEYQLLLSNFQSGAAFSQIANEVSQLNTNREIATEIKRELTGDISDFDRRLAESTEADSSSS